METSQTPLLTQIRPSIDRIVDAEQQITTTVPHMLKRVWSAQLSGLLRQMLSRSEQHLADLTACYPLQPRTSSVITENVLIASATGVAGSQPNENSSDLSITLTAARMVQHSIRCYEAASDHWELTNQPEISHVIGKALADELATDLFLQELAEHLFTMEFPSQKPI